MVIYEDSRPVPRIFPAYSPGFEKMLQLKPLEETRAVREWMQQGQISVLAQQIEERFLVPASLASLTLAPLNREALAELARLILRFQTADELAVWIEAHKTNGRDEGVD